MIIQWQEKDGVHILSADLSQGGLFAKVLSFTPKDIQAIKAKGKWVVFDMTGIEILEQNALEFLAGVARSARQGGGVFAIVNPAQNILQEIESKGLTNIVPYRYSLDDTIEEIVRAVQSGDAMATMIHGNLSVQRPSMVVRIQKVVKRQRDHSPKPPPAAPSKRAERETSDEVRKPTPVPPTPSGGSNDWEKALAIYQMAAALARKHGMEITAETTFEEFFALVSEKTDHKI